MSDDDGTRRPGRPAPRYGEYAASPTSSSSAEGSGLSEADARIVAEAAEYRRAQAERDAPASAGRGKKAGRSAAPQTLAEQMAEERKAARERQQAERRDAEKAAADARRAAEKAAAADRRGTRRAPGTASAPDPAASAPGTRPERPAYLAGQEPRRAPRRFDAAITVGLLAAGLVNVAGSIGANADPSQAINQSYALFGGGTYEVTPQTSVIGIAVNVVNIVAAPPSFVVPRVELRLASSATCRASRAGAWPRRRGRPWPTPPSCPRRGGRTSSCPRPRRRP